MTEVILVNEQDESVGTMEKMEAHKKALLHRAFSVFIFNANGEMLLQKRANSKYHSAGLWTNACCSHPLPGEETKAAALRRLKEELGFETDLTEAFKFIYKAPFDNGLTEHEVDHVFSGFYEKEIRPDPLEVGEYKYERIDLIEKDLKVQPEKYTAWFKIAFPKIKEWLASTRI